MPEIFRETVLVLRTFPVSESDLICVLLGEARGKIRAVAKNARSSKKRFPGGIDVLESGPAELRERRQGDGLLFLESYSARELWPGLRCDLLKLALAYCCLELADELAGEGDCEASCLLSPLYGCFSSLSEAANAAHCFAAAALCLFDLLSLSGLNPLEHETAFDARSKSVIKELKIDYAQQDLDTREIRETFFALTLFAEHILGHRLKSLTAVSLG